MYNSSTQGTNKTDFQSAALPVLEYETAPPSSAPAQIPSAVGIGRAIVRVQRPKDAKPGIRFALGSRKKGRSR